MTQPPPLPDWCRSLPRCTPHNNTIARRCRSLPLDKFRAAAAVAAAAEHSALHKLAAATRDAQSTDSTLAPTVARPLLLLPLPPSPSPDPTPLPPAVALPQ
jgi:hypothetical protein